uniref:Uncharacterized protein n=1 Tax=viral metagenome TaxID=1070528 RepID=A0A6M3LAA8_9ZZZZ
MSETKHTPGPWKECNGLIFGCSVGGFLMEKTEFMIAEVRGWGHLQYLGENEAVSIQEANARLIAAAPDLLKVCEFLAEVFPEDSIESMDAADFKDRAGKTMKAAEMAKTAITKAEGK